MKKIGVLLLALIGTTMSYGQLAKIVDKDGYVNVREKGNANSNIVGKVNSGEIVLLFDVDESNPNWSTIDTGISNEMEGYVHNSRLKRLETYTHIPLISSTNNELKYSGSNIDITISMGAFDYKKNKSKFSKHQGTNFLWEYNGQEMRGTDGTEPTKHYTSIKVKQKGVDIALPTKAYENMFQPSGAEYTACYYDKSDNTIYLTANNSDGAGSYTVVWVFKNGKYEYNDVFILF
ncbi:SH3 domain-containing protein [Myroides marinus]|uniref:SH3 domain-containing protein n=1 Tax=Myroides marinus TaxID=703342 RepID=UPI000741C313|nr:SH3 domain-containing protein [Myroides marinus]KUF39467.1 hypothetical protein AS361_02490 [Myroides marinus]MDM1345910.1 SH3 domain-containing protein [Myroides marinus]MDM1349229.1 SH3 domain-containing protein [Myroides marinus]MDM1353093.1 SH3 domain-containing protein [Myroides marinus]MDM1356439.1 SH3 domain-containing protein [Myroides marinus]